MDPNMDVSFAQHAAGMPTQFKFPIRSV